MQYRYKKENETIIEFKSRSFLQNQVRSMVGSLEYLSREMDFVFKKVFESKKRSECAHQLQLVVYILKCKVLSSYKFLNPYFINEFKDIKVKESKFSNTFSLLNFLLIFHIQ